MAPAWRRREARVTPTLPAHWARSLRFRLLAATLSGLAVATLLAGLVLAGIFRSHVMRQFEAGLAQQLDQLTARLEFDAGGQPVIDVDSLSDPRWQRPYSGLYWQLDERARDAPGARDRPGVLRSRSLWDTSLQLQADALADGSVHVHEGTGPQGARLLMLERTVQADAAPGSRWRLVVAADLHEVAEAVGRFNGVLALSLAVLAGLLALAAWAQVTVGLRPLRALQQSLHALQQGRSARLQGRFPAEVQPLVDDFNRVLEHQAAGVERARTQAGNLAHALKTPLSVLEQAAAREAPGVASAAVPGQPAPPTLPALVREQVAVARRHVDGHLARARVAATRALPGQRTPVAPVARGLLRVMDRVHAARGLRLQLQASDEVCFAGEEQDLQEILGNLLDNACKWARSSVTLHAEPLPGASPPRLRIQVQDDGPGIDAGQRLAVLGRGVRLDESVPGSGLGLAIVQDLVGLYGGSMDLQPGTDGGLCVRLELPLAAA
jgi:signal transduction histidine kinase